MPASLRRLRPSRRTAVLLGAALTVLVGGGAVLFAVFRPDSPASTVRQYFAELADGDTAAALALVDDEAEYSPADFPLLVPQALSDTRTRPSDLQILSTDSATAVTGEQAEIVRVSYQIRDETVTQDFVLTKGREGAPAYVLHQPFLELDVRSLAGRPLTVNGVTATLGEAANAYVFPGAYTATAQGNALIADARQAATVRPGASGEPVAVIDFGAPALAPGAQEAVQAMVRQQLDTCAQSTEAAPSDCPFSTFIFGYSEVSVKWTITAYPTLTIAPSADPSADRQVDISSPANDGVAHYVATYGDSFSDERQTETGDDDFGVQGTAAASGSEITVSLEAGIP